MKNSILFFCLSVAFLFCFSCNEIMPSKKDMARVNRINGILLFVQAEPLAEYEVIGRLQHDAVLETFEQGRGKKFGEAFGAMLSKTVDNMKLKEQLYKMTELAKQQKPETEAIIISDRAFDAQLIKFN